MDAPDTTDAPDNPDATPPIRSDLFRAAVSTGVSLVLTGILITVALLVPEDPAALLLLPAPILFYLGFWLIYTAVYLWWTHRVYVRSDQESLRDLAFRDRRDRNNWITRVAGSGDATDLTILAAVMAVVITVAIALTPGARENPLLILLGLAVVSSSWALMVYAFALEYMRDCLVQEDPDAPHISFAFEERPEFTDYLTFSLTVSTMAVSSPAEVTTRAMWRKLRTHVLLAFVFNTVIVAMMVSLLFGGLTAE